MDDNPTRNQPTDSGDAPGPPGLTPAMSASMAGASRWDEWTGFLHNRLVLGALGVVVVLLLAVVVLVVLGQGSERTASSVVAERPSTREPAATDVRPLGGLLGEALNTITLRNGPGTRFTPLGTIARGTMVAVVGRSEDDHWLQVRYPPNSDLRGWVDSRFLEVNGDVTRLVVAGPGPVPHVEQPTGLLPVTPAPVITFDDEPTRTPRPSRTPRATRTPPRQTPTATVRPADTPIFTREPDPTPTATPEPATPASDLP
jgi:uncharacterized protein YraI